MDLDLRTLSSADEVDRYAQALAEALTALGHAVRLGGGVRSWWESKHGLAIGVGKPSAARRLDAWIWLDGSAKEATELKGDHPDWAIAVADTQALATELPVLPFPIVEAFFAPGDGTAQFDVTKRFHLEQRPRIVMMGPFRDGRGLTVALAAMVRLLASGGELVVLDGLRIRPQFAPVISRLGLVDKAVFLPPLADADTAAVLLGSDLAILPERVDHFPYWIPWCHAAGVPVVAIDTKETRIAVGTAALLVDPERDDGFENAVREVLSNRATHRHLITRGMAQAERARSTEVAKALASWAGTLMGSRP